MIGIYKITNQVNGKVYIGQSVHIKARWQQHILNARNNKENTLLYNAMRKHGIENFSFEVIEECDKEKLNEREVYWISYYDSFNKEKGYNMTPGGSEPIKINPQEIYDLWDQGYSVKEIKEQLKDKVCGATVGSYLQGYKNWSTTESQRRGQSYAKKLNYSRENNLNVIKQYDIFGNFLKNWQTCRQIENELKIPHNSISNAIRGKAMQAGGFQWREGIKDDNTNIESIIDKTPLHFKVYQKDKNGNIVGYYNSVTDAAKAVNTSSTNIARVCQKKNGRKTAKGFIWEYDYNSWYDPN